MLARERHCYKKSRFGPFNLQCLSAQVSIKMTRKLLGVLLVPFPFLPVYAADDEIQVYEDDINAPHELTVDMHLNYVPAARTSSTPVQIPSLDRFRLTPEFAYGLTKNLEVGAYLPMLKGADDAPQVIGAKLRLKYIDADNARSWYWGLNAELEHVSLAVDDHHWGLELRPILGYRIDRWTVAFNPIVAWSLSDAPASSTPEFSPSVKVGYYIGQDWRVGLEHYAAFGPLDEALPVREQGQNTYLALDGKLWGHNFNFGIGRGWTHESDTWVVKAIINFPL